MISVISTGIFEVRIEFSEEIDGITATDGTNYQISGITVSGAILDPSAKVVRLNTLAQYYINYDITVSAEIKDRNNNKMIADYNGTFLGAADAPRVFAAVPQGTNTIRIEFSEAMDPGSAGTAGNYSLSPLITVDSATHDPGGAGAQYVDLSLAEDTLEISYTITVTGVTDVNKNIINPIYDEAGFTGDIRPTVISVSSTGSTTVRVGFSEEVAAGTAGDTGNYDIEGLSVSGVTIDTASTVTLATADQSIIVYDITISGILDTNGNAMQPDYTGSFNGAVDAPRVIDASAVDTTSIRVEFSEALDPDSAGAPGNYSLSPSITVISATHDPGGAGPQYVDLMLGGYMSAIGYQVTVDGVRDAALNTLDPLYDEAGFTGDARPTVLSVSSTSNTEVRVEFSEAVNAGSAGNTINYAITDLTVSGITIDSDTVVRLTTSTQSKTIYPVTISGITDTNGNTLQPDFNGSFSAPQDLPTVVSAAAVNKSTVRVEFSEALDLITAENPENYTLLPPITVNSAILNPGGGGTQYVDLALSDEMSQLNYTVTVSGVRDVAQNIVDTLYNTAGFTGDVRPTVTSVTSTSITKIRIEFSEAVTADTAGNAANYAISGLTVSGTTIDSDTVVRLTTSTQAETIYTITISGITDTNGNTIQPDFNGSFSAPQEAPRVVRAAAVGTTTVRVEFSEALDPAPAQTAGNYSISPSIAINAATLNPGGAGTQYVDLALVGDTSGTNYTLSVPGIRDSTGNVIDPLFDVAGFAGDARPQVSMITAV